MPDRITLPIDTNVYRDNEYQPFHSALKFSYNFYSGRKIFKKMHYSIKKKNQFGNYLLVLFNINILQRLKT